MRQSVRNLKLLSLVTISLISSIVVANAQKRDHFTEMESDLIRENQEINMRMAVFTKAIDRRFIVLNKSEAANDKQVKKDLETWGELPKGTNAQLLTDIEKILNEGINNIDDVASRDLKNKLLPKAMKTLVEGCKKYLPQLSSLNEKSTEQLEKDAIAAALEYCGEIIEAQSKVSEPEPKQKP
jgi:hypothetical protein